MTTLQPRGNGHKGTFGKLLVVGGSPDMIGAPMLAALAAYRSGCGYVIAALPRPVLAAALSVVPEVVGLGLDEESEKKLLATAHDADALVIGPGLGRQPAAEARLEALLDVNKPTVLDADGLTLWAEQPKWWERLPGCGVLTPHPGEAARISNGDVPSDESGRRQWAVDHARQWNTTLVLKGERTVIAAPDGRVAINDTGDSTLAKAGSGDVLSGLLGTLLAQGHDCFDAAVLAAHVHGRAGELAGQLWTKRGALARDVCDQLPHALAEVEEV